MTFLFGNLAFAWWQVAVPAIAGIVLIEVLRERMDLGAWTRWLQGAVGTLAILIFGLMAINQPLAVNTVEDRYGEQPVRSGEVVSTAPERQSDTERLEATRAQVEAGELPR